MAYPESHCRIGCKRVKGSFLDLSEYKDATDNGECIVTARPAA